MARRKKSLVRLVNLLNASGNREVEVVKDAVAGFANKARRAAERSLLLSVNSGSRTR